MHVQPRSRTMIRAAVDRFRIHDVTLVSFEETDGLRLYNLDAEPSVLQFPNDGSRSFAALWMFVRSMCVLAGNPSDVRTWRIDGEAVTTELIHDAFHHSMRDETAQALREREEERELLKRVNASWDNPLSHAPETDGLDVAWDPTPAMDNAHSLLDILDAGWDAAASTHEADALDTGWDLDDECAA